MNSSNLSFLESSKRQAYRLIQPSIELILLSGVRNGLNSTSSQNIVKDSLLIYGGAYLHLRNILPKLINTKKYCASLACNYVSNKNLSESDFNLDFNSDRTFLSSSIKPLENCDWSNPKSTLEDYFGSLNCFLTNNEPNFSLSKGLKPILSGDLKSDSKIKSLGDYIFDEVKREDIVGNESLLDELEKIGMALMHYDINSKHNLFDFNQYVLLNGLPGTGKTMVSKYLMSYVKNISKENNLPAKFVKLDFEDRWQNGPLENLKHQFEQISKGENFYLVFLDELDLKFPNRQGNNNYSEDQVLGELLRFRGGCYSNNNNYVFLGTTNKPENIDSALTSVFKKYDLYPPRSVADKKKIIESNLKGYNLNINWASIDYFLENSNLTGRDLMNVGIGIKNSYLGLAKNIPFNVSDKEKQKMFSRMLEENPVTSKDIINQLKRGLENEI